MTNKLYVVQIERSGCFPKQHNNPLTFAEAQKLRDKLISENKFFPNEIAVRFFDPSHRSTIVPVDLTK